MKTLNFIKLWKNDFSTLQIYMNKLAKYEKDILKNKFLKPNWVFTENWKAVLTKIIY